MNIHFDKFISIYIAHVHKSILMKTSVGLYNNIKLKSDENDDFVYNGILHRTCFFVVEAAFLILLLFYFILSQDKTYKRQKDKQFSQPRKDVHKTKIQTILLATKRRTKDKNTNNSLSHEKTYKRQKIQTILLATKRRTKDKNTNNFLSQDNTYKRQKDKQFSTKYCTENETGC